MGCNKMEVNKVKASSHDENHLQRTLQFVGMAKVYFLAPQNH